MDFVCAFDDSIFVGNSAVLRGGAIGFLVGHDNTVLECTFINNTSPVGGALYLVNTGSKLVIRNSKFINNSAVRKGGAIYNDADIEINESFFSGNLAGDGGCICNMGDLTLNSSSFISNFADNYGGVIYNTNKLNICFSNFTRNNADLGGCVFNTKKLNLKSCYFLNNNVLYAGSCYNGGNLTIYLSNFVNNKATNNGGVIYNLNSLIVNFSNLLEIMQIMGELYIIMLL